MTIKILAKSLLRAIVAWWRHDAFTQSAAIAYYTIFSFPALIILYFACASLFVDEAQIQNQVYDFLSGSFGSEASVQFQKIIEKTAPAETNFWAFAIAASVLIFTGLKVFLQLQRALNLVWQVDDSQLSTVRKLVFRRIASFGVMVGIGFTLLVSMLATSMLSVLTEYITNWLPDYFTFLLHGLNLLMSLTMVTITLGFMLKKLPDVHVGWGNAMLGGFLSALLFVMGEYGLGLYFSIAQPNSAYGVTGSLILLMLWVSYSATILLLGAEFSRDLQMNKTAESSI